MYLTSPDHISSFSEAMVAHGVLLDEPLRADGELHRYHVKGDKRGTRNAFAILNLDGCPAGAFGDHKRMPGQTVRWKADTFKSLSAAELRALNDRAVASAARARERTEKRKQAAATLAAEVWTTAAECVAHPYLAAKGVRSHGLRVSDWVRRGVDRITGEVWESRVENTLLIPILNARGSIVSLQGIFAHKNANGRNKEFLAGGQKADCFFRIGPRTKNEATAVIAICEGYATAASIFEATGTTVLVAFDAGNLGRVARVVRAIKPAIKIVLAADDDRMTPGNPGVSAATRAANDVEGVLWTPQFARGGEGNDFNDLHRSEGLQTVRDQYLRLMDQRG